MFLINQSLPRYNIQDAYLLGIATVYLTDIIWVTMFT